LRGWTKHVRSITKRPKFIEKRLRIDDWEGDTVVGGDRTRLFVHIERKSRFVVADLVASGNADVVATRVVKRFKKLPAFTITYDRGSEFALWKYLQEELAIRVFFAEPHHPWERGTCENTNGLIRRFVPKRSVLSTLTRQRVAKIAWNLNHRSRKCLNWKTPCQVAGFCCRERTRASRFEGLWGRTRSQDVPSSCTMPTVDLVH
jgi:IS30 family transposase